MNKRTIGLIVTVAGIIGYLLTSERARWFSMQNYIARHSPGGGAPISNPAEMVAKYKFWMELSIGCGLITVIGVIIIITGYNRIRRNRQANGR